MNFRSLILALAFATALGSAVFVISGAALTAGTTAQTTNKSAVKAAVQTLENVR